MNALKPPSISIFGVVVTLATVLLIFASVSFPLVGTLGAESGILFGAIVGPLMYLSGAIRGAYRDDRGFKSDLIHEFSLAALALLAFATALFINGFYTSSCVGARGFLPFITHALPVIGFDLACGLLIGRVCGNRLLALFASLVIAAAYGVIRGLIWWQNPNFRFLSHPLIVLDGDLGQGAGLSAEVLGFRVATALFALALILLGLMLFSSSQRSQFSQDMGARFAGIFPIVALVLIGGFVHCAVTDKLEPSASDRVKVLARESRRGQYVVHSDPSKTTSDEALAILAEASLWGSRLRARLGDVSGSDIHIWLYPDKETLSRFTGAKHFHFALPDHREVHIVKAEIPHLTLGHEIAHVMVGETLSGLIPSAGLNEGFAMALTPELSIRGDLTLQEQAAALAQSDRLPNLKDLFSTSPLGFLSNNMGMSYSVAGAYIEELLARETDAKAKAALVKRIALASNLDAAFDSDVARSNFEAAWVQKLKSKTLSKDAMTVVAALFGSPPVLMETCEDREEKHDDLVKDPLALGLLLEREAEKTPSSRLLRKQFILKDAADEYWKAGRQKQAAELYKIIQLDLIPPSERREFEAKALFSSNLSSLVARRALDFLVNAHDKNIKFNAAALSLGADLEKRNLEAEDATPSQVELIALYLSLRSKIVANGNTADLLLLERLATNKLMPPSFQAESMRLIAMTRALGSKPTIAADQFRQMGTLYQRAALAIEMLDFAERAELIAAAAALEDSDPRKSDKWLLGTNRFDP